MKFGRAITMWRPVSRPCRKQSLLFWKASVLRMHFANAVSLGGDSDTLACITGGIAEAFYGMPQKLRDETLKRLPEDIREGYELFRWNIGQR